ncbi:MAG: (2Fe-2S)-binding protein [Ignavibacteriae bacterium]|nr:(2Fe-2S)-binding protein [Ignavibacteriota bacterium]
MAKITLDGKQFEVEDGRTIIEAARENGIEIPHFCWHPKLSVSGNCRMCLVEVEKLPKLVIACATRVVDGMVVNTVNPRVAKAREAVMEFLLINHPLDCPICDEAGECKLQDYAYAHSTGASRFTEDKVHKPKRVELGPRVMLDTERCIMCSRCVRFCSEIAAKPQLTFSQRGDRVELTTFPGEQLDNPYSMNTIDICPVGALTNRDFRFKARVWEMSSTETVCPGCARGCSMYSWVRNNEILRQTPRYNPDVNDHWMCDQGRLETFRHVNADDRIKAPLIRKEAECVEVGWDEAIARTASEFRVYRKAEIAVFGSARATNEDHFLLQKFAREVLGTKQVIVLPHVVPGDDDALLLRADKTPNARGVALMGATSSGALVDVLRRIEAGEIRAAFVMEDDIAADPAIAAALPKLDFLAVHASNESETTRLADVVFPAATFAERNGTYTNFQGVVQRIRPSVTTLDQDRASDGLAMSRWDKFGTAFDRWGRGAKRDARPGWKVIAGIASVMGMKYKYLQAEDVFAELASVVEAFKGMTYRSLGSRGQMLVPAREHTVRS